MANPAVPRIVNFFAFELCWTATVLGAAKGLWWLGPLVIGVHLAAHLLYLRRGENDGRFLLAALAVGVLIESILALAGVFRFASPVPGVAWLCPPWLALLWPNLGTAVVLSLSWLKDRLVGQIVFGAVGGPLAYWAGSKLGAMSTDLPMALFLGIIAVVWAGAVPLLYWLKNVV